MLLCNVSQICTSKIYMGGLAHTRTHDSSRHKPLGQYIRSVMNVTPSHANLVEEQRGRGPG